jgi:Skp family chaperone for outer membrane proteins
VSAQQKVGIIDEGVVLNDLPETQKVEAEIKALIGNWADTAAAYSKLIADRRDNLRAKTASMTSEQRRAEVDTISRMNQMLSQYTIDRQSNSTGELAKVRAEKYGPILKKYREAINTVAKREKIDIVMVKGKIVYLSPSAVDISPLVKKEMK